MIPSKKKKAHQRVHHYRILKSSRRAGSTLSILPPKIRIASSLVVLFSLSVNVFTLNVAWPQPDQVPLLGVSTVGERITSAGERVKLQTELAERD